MADKVQLNNLLPRVQCQLPPSPINNLLRRFIVHNGIHKITKRRPLLLLRLLAHVMRALHGQFRDPLLHLVHQHLPLAPIPRPTSKTPFCGIVRLLPIEAQIQSTFVNQRDAFARRTSQSRLRGVEAARQQREQLQSPSQTGVVVESVSRGDVPIVKCGAQQRPAIQCSGSQQWTDDFPAIILIPDLFTEVHDRSAILPLFETIRAADEVHHGETAEGGRSDLGGASGGVDDLC
mmetsp:Transcript_23595/g.38305  ORF Transcript_23595/g.38305 Transcript_23595/m.38305 type:complete len:234 (-) Transcript_23595:227-928(-)